MSFHSIFLIPITNLGPNIRSDLPFRFGSHLVANLSTDGVFALSTADLIAYVMVYLDLKTVKSRRNTLVKLSYVNRLNPPSRVFDKKYNAGCI